VALKVKIINTIKLLLEPLINLTGRAKRLKPEKRFWELIHKNFPVGKDFHFIQVGANDGVSFDNLYDIAKGRLSSGIVIEPMKDFYEMLCDNYRDFPQIKKVNKAVHPSLKIVCLYRVDPNRQHELESWTAGIASLDPLHHKKSNTANEYIIEEKVAAASLMEIVEETTTSYDVDLLQIDVEGFDYEILKMVNFQLIKPSVVKYEFCILSEHDKKESKKLLRRQGYYLYTIGDDMIGIVLDKIKL
jgi:FkbM family methyltransferase